MKETTTTWQADLYNNKHAFVYQYGENVLELLAPKAGERILDLGCGSGQLTAKLKELGTDVVGIDYSEEMIADARQKYPHIEFLVKDAGDFTFSEPFDAIFSNAVLHWVINKEQAIACMYRNLKVGGRMVAEFGGKGNVQIILSQLKKTLDKHGFASNAQRDIFYFPSIGEYTSLLEKQGFRVTFAQHFDRPTELSDSNKGIQDWLEMFGNAFFQGMSEVQKEQVKAEVAQLVKDKLYLNGKWYADYKRIRVVAVKE